jgi:hypothetical protein
MQLILSFKVNILRRNKILPNVYAVLRGRPINHPDAIRRSPDGIRNEYHEEFDGAMTGQNA